MSIRTIAIFVTAVTLLLYGLICRDLKIYFFWDAIFIGTITLLIGAVSYLVEIIYLNKMRGRTVGRYKIALLFAIFSLAAIPALTVAIMVYSDAYKTAILYIKHDKSIQEDLGNVYGFGIVTSVSTQSFKNSTGAVDFAVFGMTVKGEKKFRDVKIELVKTPENSKWTVRSIE